jgi:hypothetical protein
MDVIVVAAAMIVAVIIYHPLLLPIPIPLPILPQYVVKKIINVRSAVVEDKL